MTYAQLLARLKRMSAVELASDVVVYSPNMCEVHDIYEIRPIEEAEREDLTVDMLEGDVVLITD